ncbi:MAG: dihydroneopterin aldolase [Sulfurimonadaceae bacterium]|jgi:dihydroneopterin aldolase|nr:dihydroneopterin aldolase [Sulfurimonadaceae bacterium]
MRIYIEDLKFLCIIGILDCERENSQEVIINLAIDYTYEKEFINYADVVNCIKTTMIERKYLLIEDALLELPLLLQNKFPLLETLYLKITKPSILSDAKVSVSTTFVSNS